MKKTITEYFCDVCRAKVEGKDLLTIQYPAISHPDPLTSSSSQCFIAHKQLEACRDCLSKMLMLHSYVGHYEVRKPTRSEIYGEETEKTDN